jgi:DNA modification methylase
VITLYHGDCLKEMSKISDGSVDMILADLPYGTTACKWDNVIPFEPLWAHYWRVLKPNGAVVLFGSEPFSSHLRMSQIKYFKYDWVWEKPNGTNFLNASFQPLKNHEIISVFSLGATSFVKGGAKPCAYFPQKTQGSTYKIKAGKKNHEWHSGKNTLLEGYVSESTERMPKTVLRYSTEKGKHPTQKPVALLEYLIRTYTVEGETVLDNTMGSGSTGVACVNAGRKFIGIEMDDKYFAIAQERINKAQEKLF